MTPPAALKLQQNLAKPPFDLPVEIMDQIFMMCDRNVLRKFLPWCSQHIIELRQYDNYQGAILGAINPIANVDYLLSQNIPVTESDLVVAARNSSMRVLNLFQSYKCVFKRETLYAALKQGNVINVKWILEIMTDVLDNDMLLFNAILSNNMGCMEICIKIGCSINVVTVGTNLGNLAAQLNQPTALKFLNNYSYKFTSNNLIVAIEFNRVCNVQYILSTSYQMLKNKDVIYSAIISENIDIIKLCMNHTGYVNNKVDTLYNDAAAELNNRNMLKFLYKYGGEFNPRIILTAAEYGNLSSMRYLLSVSNTRHKDLIHYAIVSGNIECVELCIEYGYIINKTDEFYTCLAAQHDKLPVLELLEEYGCKVTSITMCCAAENGNIDIMEHLDEQNICHINENVLNSAILGGYHDCIKLCLFYDFDNNYPLNSDHFKIAIENSDLETFSLIANMHYRFHEELLAATLDNLHLHL